MNLDVTSFNTYLERAMRKLAKDLTSSIDFYHLSEHGSPIPSRFSEHLSAVMARLQKSAGLEDDNEIGQETHLVKGLIPFMACCIAAQIPPHINRQRW